MNDVDVIPASEIDFAKFAGLQQRSFAAHLEQYKVDTDYINESYFRWKYLPSWGEASVAIATNGGDYTACVVAVPLQIGNAGKRSLMWRMVDIATDPKARGRGMYTKLLRRLIGSLSDNEVLAAFPNRNSAPGFQKVGCEDACYVPTWVSPALPLRRRHPSITKIENYCNLDSSRWRNLLMPNNLTSVIRDSRYFDWRYGQHAEYEYLSYTIDTDEECGLIVFRAANVYSKRLLYVLELWATNDKVRSRLLSAAHSYCRSESIRWIVMVSNSIGRIQGIRHFFAFVPRRIVPKQQVLRGICSDDESRTLFLDRWCVQMGDLLEF